MAAFSAIMRGMNILLSIAITTGILSGIWGWVAVSPGLLSWAGFLGCTAYFACPQGGLKGLAISAATLLSGVVWAMVIIGGFYLLTLFLGLGAALNVGPANIVALDKGGNMAAPILAQYLGGGADSMMGNFFLAFVAAVAFATIVAVVAGLVLASASAMAHDIYVGVIRGDHATPDEQVKAARVASIIVGSVAIVGAMIIMRTPSFSK